MQTVNFPCVHCGNLMAVTADNLGQHVRCPTCQQVVLAPAVTQEPTPVTHPGSGASPHQPDFHTADEPLPTLMPSTDHEDIFAAPEESDDLFGRSDAPQIEMPSDSGSVVPSPPAQVPHVPSPVTDVASAPTAPDFIPPPPPPSVEPVASEFPTPEIGLTPDPAPEADAAFSQFPSMQLDSPSATALQAPPEPGTTPSDAAAAELPATPLPSARAAARAQPARGGVSFWLVLPLLSYSLLTTAALYFLWNRTQAIEKNQNPLELYLPDAEGDKPGVIQLPKKVSDKKKKALTDAPLPAACRMRLGETREVGALAVTPERVRWHKIGLAPQGFDAAKGPLDGRALVLYLRLKNVSEDQSFQPLDRYFDRRWKGRKGPPPLTLLEAGARRYYGGPAEWNQEPDRTVRGDQPLPERVSLLDVPDAPWEDPVDRPLEPGESVEAFVCTDPTDPATAGLARHQGDFLWRVHIRRGLVEVRGLKVPAAAVLGIEFTDRDVPPEG